MSIEPHTTKTEYVTIISGDMADITRQFRAQGLSDDYSIVHRTGTHRFTFVDGDAAEQLFEGRSLIAATFARRLDA